MKKIKLEIEIHPTMKESMDRLAEKRGLNTSEYIHEMILRDYRKMFHRENYDHLLHIIKDRL